MLLQQVPTLFMCLTKHPPTQHSSHTSLLFLEHTKLSPVTGPLHILPPLPGWLTHLPPLPVSFYSEEYSLTTHLQ